MTGRAWTGAAFALICAFMAPSGSVNAAVFMAAFLIIMALAPERPKP